MPARLKATDDQVRAAYAATDSVWKAAKLLGMCGQSVHERLQKLGVDTAMNLFTSNDDMRLVADYQKYSQSGKLAELANEMSRTRHFLCRQAKRLGLSDPKIKKPYLASFTGVRMKKCFAENGHPRGMLGKKHSDSAREKMSVSNTRAWAESTEERRLENGKRLSLVTATNASRYNRDRTSWKAAWRTIGGERCFFRSAWEANYARVLQSRLDAGKILSWNHEPRIFRFPISLRNVWSYRPDFIVTTPDLEYEWHEVKGWIDDRTSAIFEQMAIHFPDEKIKVIGAKEYRELTKTISPSIDGWEK